MKITISPTEKIPNLTAEETQHSSTIEHPSDDVNIDEVFRLFSYALVAYGYHHKTVKECLEKNLGEDVFGRD